MKNRIEDLKHIRTQVQSIQDQISQVILKMEGKPGPTPPPVNPPPETGAKWSIERHPVSEPLHGGSFPAGTPINFNVRTLRDGSNPYPTDRSVIWITPAGEEKRPIDSAGNSGIHRVVVPEGGMRLVAYIEGLPDVKTAFDIKATGSFTPPSDPPPSEEPDHDDYRYDADGRKIHPSGYKPKKPEFDWKEVSVPHGDAEVGVLFLGKNFVLPPRTRVLINNRVYDFQNRTDYDFHIEPRRPNRAKGFILKLGTGLARVATHPQDIWDESYGNHGYMNFSWKILAKQNAYDYHNINTSDRDHPNYWAGQEFGGRMMLRHGWNAVWEPNPRFWEFNLHEKRVINSYNRSRKFLIIIGNPTDWKSLHDRADWHPIP